MFDRISHKYDLLNTIMTVGRHHIWRNKAAELAITDLKGTALDVASGTGDFGLRLLLNDNVVKVIALDFAKDMLAIGQFKAEKKNLKKQLIPIVADAHRLPFKTSSFICTTVGFGVRNFIEFHVALKELIRVTQPKGKIVILEIVKPEGRIMSKIFPFYFEKITPIIGSFFAGDKEAYTYLPESVFQFMTASELSEMMKKYGLINVAVHNFAIRLQ